MKNNETDKDDKKKKDSNKFDFNSAYETYKEIIVISKSKCSKQ